MCVCIVDPWTTWVWSVWIYLYASFLKVNNIVLHDPQLAESADVEPWMGGNHVHEGPAINYTQGLSFGDGQCL